MNYHQLKMFVINDGGLMSDIDIDYLAAKWILLEKQRYIRPMGVAVNLAHYDIDAAITHAHEVYRTTYKRYEGRRAWYWWANSVSLHGLTKTLLFAGEHRGRQDMCTSCSPNWI